jgi:hypothetical protein
MTQTSTKHVTANHTSGHHRVTARDIHDAVDPAKNELPALAQ